jgi:hypothetical protein
MNGLTRLTKLLAGAFATVLVLGISACGGGGGGGGGDPGSPPSSAVLISGTAAAGAPIVGYVSVRDSSANPQPVRTGIPIDAAGHFTVDVTGLTPPYAFLASGTVGGRSLTLYSAATSADEGKTINITPFTDLMIRNIAASAVDNYIDNGGLTGLTAAELDAARVTLTQQLAPALLAMGLSDSIDLLRATFNADSTGLDRFMDVVKVSTTPTTATITNIMDAANTLIIDTTNGTTTGSLGTGGLAPSGTDVDLIVQTLNTFANQFATGLPTPAALVPLFADTYLDGGIGRDAFLTDITTDPGLIGLRVTGIVVDALDTAAGTAVVHFVPVFAGNLIMADKPGGSVVWHMRKIGGEWKVNGDQRIAYVYVHASANRLACNPANPVCSMSPQYGTGLNLTVGDEGMIGIASALVTGPGLPASGVRLVAQAASTDFDVSTSNPVCGGTCPRPDVWFMSDTDIGNIPPNSFYEIALYDNANTLLATYSVLLPMPPVLNSQLATLPFPTLSGLVNLAGVGGTILTPSWSVPSGTRPAEVAVRLDNTPNFDRVYVEDDLSFTAALSGTSTLVVRAPSSGTWTGGWYSIGAYDQYAGERFAAYW